MPTTPRTKKETLAWLRTISGELSTATIKRLEDTLPWYGDMPPGRRSAVGLVAQAGITSFISWYDDPKSIPWIAADVFGAAPRELLRSVSLQQTLQLIRVVVEVVEHRVKDGSVDLREAILLYSREIAFAAADVYARAAEARGLWDARLEALVVDSILSGEYDDELPSRIAALGWHGHGAVAVLVGTTPRMLDVDVLRRAARHMAADVLIGVQGGRLVLVIGRATPRGARWRRRRARRRPLGFMDIAQGARTALRRRPPGARPRGAEPRRRLEERQGRPRRVRRRPRLAERARARCRPTTCCPSAPSPATRSPAPRSIHRIYRPLSAHSTELLNTLWCYLDNGRSLEATARELFVHPNTVRYRLKRVSEVIGWDATGSREALILQAALVLGAISDPDRRD